MPALERLKPWPFAAPAALLRGSEQKSLGTKSSSLLFKAQTAVQSAPAFCF